MTETVLQTKHYIPPLRPNLVPRLHLTERLNQGLQLGHKLTLISAPAGFGKTTLASEWLAGVQRPVAWLSLDADDSDLSRFLTYFVTALKTLTQSDVDGAVPAIGDGALSMLQSPQPPPTELILTALVNEITAVPDNFILVLDDYHLVDAQAVDASASVDVALTFLLEHQPPQMHLAIATREDPGLPLARLRARGQLTELRVADLRFTPDEAAAFLNQVMGLDLSTEEVAALEIRTEGWIAGLQLAALSMKGQKDTAGFIKSFTGSHHFVLDYLVEEVLHQQSERIQTFLLQTSILDRLCGPLCDAVCSGRFHESLSSSFGTDAGRFHESLSSSLGSESTASGQETLEYLQQANLFIVPLDNERRWYRYHHLFADLMRQRLQQSAASSSGGAGGIVAELHIRASVWYEEQGLQIEAFQHAAAANDVERAARLIEGEGVPLQYLGAATPVRNWLASLPVTVLDSRPSLWVTYASALNLTGQPADAEQKLQAAEAALQGAEPDDKSNDIAGHIAAIRAMMAVSQNEGEIILAQSQLALEYLHPDNLAVRTIITWTLGYAYQLQGKYDAAGQAYSEVIAASQASGDIISTLAATTGLGNIQESQNQLFLAAESYRLGLQLFGDQPQPVACETSLRLARIFYEWDDLDAAEEYGQQGLQLARQVPNVDTFAICGVFLARLKLTRGDLDGAAALIADADQFMRQRNYVDRLPEVTAAQILILLHQGNLAAAAHLAKQHELPISQARVHLAQGNTSEALAVLRPFREQVEAKGLQDERLKVLVLQAVALHAHGEKDEALQLLGDALVLAQPGGFIRTFVDEGPPMANLLHEAVFREIAPDYTRHLLAAFATAPAKQTSPPEAQSALGEPLSQRELEVLQLIAQGLSNREISERLFLALDTVKGHNRNIFSKLQVHRRTEAVARARELGLV